MGRGIVVGREVTPSEYPALTYRTGTHIDNVEDTPNNSQECIVSVVQHVNRPLRSLPIIKEYRIKPLQKLHQKQ